MTIQDFIDLREIVERVSVNNNFIEVSGMWDQTYSCILCSGCSMNSITDIKHDENCVSKRLDNLYDTLSNTIYNLTTD